MLPLRSLPVLPPPRDRAAAAPQRRRPTAAWWAETMDPGHTTDDEFKKALRVPRSVFSKVLKGIQDHPVFDAPPNVGARALPVDKQLACFLLRIGANQSIHEIRKKLTLSESSVSVCTRRVTAAICDNLGHFVRMPRNGTPAKAKVAKMFKARDPAFKDCRGIVDCTHVNITPPIEEVRGGHLAAYVGRSGEATLTFQAIVTPERTPRFLSVSGALPGSAYDTRVLQKSYIYKNLSDYLVGDEYLAGDCGYSLRPWMMRGWSNSELPSSDPKTRDRRSFNKLFSNMRISVERAFGILKARFRAWASKITFRREDDYKTAFVACCILHNICAEDTAAALPEKDIESFADAEHNHKNKKRARDGDVRDEADVLGGDIEAGRQKRDKILRVLLGKD